MKFTRKINLEIHFRPDKNTCPELSGVLKISSPRPLDDAQINTVMAAAMETLRKTAPGFQPTPSLEDFAWALYSAAHATQQLIWDIEIVQPEAETKIKQDIDAIGRYHGAEVKTAANSKGG